MHKFLGNVDYTKNQELHSPKGDIIIIIMEHIALQDEIGFSHHSHLFVLIISYNIMNANTQKSQSSLFILSIKLNLCHAQKHDANELHEQKIMTNIILCHAPVHNI